MIFFSFALDLVSLISDIYLYCFFHLPCGDLRVYVSVNIFYYVGSVNVNQHFYLPKDLFLLNNCNKTKNNYIWHWGNLSSDKEQNTEFSLADWSFLHLVFLIAESFIPPSFPALISSILICRTEVCILICSAEVAGDFSILILKCIAHSFCLDLRKRTMHKGPLPTRMLHKELAVIAALVSLRTKAFIFSPTYSVNG